MSGPFIEHSEEGKPLRPHELNVEELAEWLHKNKIRTSQGKIIQPLHDAHLEILNDAARFKVLACGRRFGKTLIASLVALATLMQINRRVWIVAPDYSLTEKVFRELYHILVIQLKLIQPGKPGGGRARSQAGDYYLQTPWGSVLEGKSMQNPDSLAGEANDLVIVDEAALQPNIEDIWTRMLKPTLADKLGSAIFISTPRGKNTFYKLYLNGQLGKKQVKGEADITIDKETNLSNDMRDWSSFKKTSYDNPLLSVTPEASKKEIDDAYRESVLNGRSASFKQEWLADFESVSDSCFPGFSVEKSDICQFPNVVDYTWHPDEGPVYAACDHNFAKPASTIFAQVNKFGDVIIFDERFTPHTTSYMQAQQIIEKQRDLTKRALSLWKEEQIEIGRQHHITFQEVVADISGDQVQLNGRTAWSDFEAILNRKPVGLKQDRETGCNMIRLWSEFPQFDAKGKPIFDEKNQQVKRPKLFVTRNCVNTIYALSTAMFKKGKNGILKEDYEEVPEGYEGLIDALRYLMVYLFHNKGNYFSVVKGVN